MSKQRKRAGLAAGANPETKSQYNRHHDSRIPPHTPPGIARALTRALRRLGDLADTGANVSISVAYIDTRDEITGLLITDEETAVLASRVVSPGVIVFEAGRRAQA